MSEMYLFIYIIRHNMMVAGYIKPKSLKEFMYGDGIFAYFSLCFVTRPKRKQIVFSAHDISQQQDYGGEGFRRWTGVVERWELDYIGGSERVSRSVECQLRKQESPTDPKRPIIHFSRSFFILHCIKRNTYIAVSTDDNNILRFHLCVYCIFTNWQSVSKWYIFYFRHFFFICFVKN